jgi:transcriptional regulator with XRE-family HTH domain
LAVGPAKPGRYRQSGVRKAGDRITPRANALGEWLVMDAKPIGRKGRRGRGPKVTAQASARISPMTVAERSPSVSNAPAHDGLMLEISIGRKIRALLQKLQLTGADLASEARVSLGMPSKIENGGISPSLSTLQSLAEALNVPMTSFFADYEESSDCSFVKSRKGLPIERRGTKAGHRYELIGHSIAAISRSSLI